MKNRIAREVIFEDVDKNHNHSWYEEIYLRNKNNLNKTAISFWDCDISYGTFFDSVITYAKALKYHGVNKGDEFIACVRQMPDYPVIVAAASYIGATVLLIAPEFDKKYIEELISISNAKIVIVSDWDLSAIVEPLTNSTLDKVVIIPMSKWGKDPHFDVSSRFYMFDEESYKIAFSELTNAIYIDEFLALGESFDGELNGNGKLDDIIAVTYSSGSTKKGFHKGIPQKNRTYIIMGRYHDPEVTGIPKMDKTRTYVCVGTQADTLLLSGVSDTLMQSGIVVLDPIIDEKYFVYSLLFYRAGLVIATRTTWLRAMKETYSNPELKGLKLPYLYVPSEGGEPLSAGEEYALNKWLKCVNAGTAITHTPFCITKMSVGGGDSEHGSLFLILFRGYYNFIQKLRNIKEPIGMAYYDFAEVESLRADGTYCNPMEMGRLVANSPISMTNYHHDDAATSKYFITDVTGKVWGDLGVYGYIDKWKNVYIKGRISENDPRIKPFEISDLIMQDYKNIMSCEVVPIYSDDKLIYVAHIEFQSFHKSDEVLLLEKIKKRLIDCYGDKLNGCLYIRIRTNKEGFPTLFTAKRNMHKLLSEGMVNATRLL